MSKTHKREVSSCQAVEDYLRRTGSCCYKGTKLSDRDCKSYLLAIGLQVRILQDLLSDRTPNRSRRLLPWSRTMVELDVERLATFLKDVVSYIRHYAEMDRTTYECFKHTLGKQFPFVGDFLSPIKEEMERFLTSPNPSDFATINQHVSFLSRLSFRDVDLSTKALEDYLETETHLANVEHDFPLYNDLNKIIRQWFSGFEFGEFIPKHGNGSVAHMGHASIGEKYSNLGTDTLIEYFLRRLGMSTKDIYPLDPLSVDRCCEVTFVPKSITAFRTISMEPATLQYLQQGVWASLDRYMTHHPYLRDIVHIHDQSFNRKLAQVGSANDGSYATIDLSSASDCVSWVLAKSLFAGTPLLPALYATRSRYALLPNGERLPLLKYAPMGSALCFPIECIIFAAISELAKRNSGGKESLRAFLVYGDDIVTRREYVYETVRILHACGFRVNASKTFFSPHNPFRESCGGEYYLGVDVSPMRISRKFSCDPPSRHHPTVFENHIELANIAYQYGFKLVRLWFIQRLLHLPQKYQPIFTLDDTHLRSGTPSNYHLRKIWFDWWQVDLYNHGSVASTVDKKRKEVRDAECIRLFEWHRQARGRDRLAWPEDLIIADVSRKKPTLISCLTPIDPVIGTVEYTHDIELDNLLS